MRLITSYTNPDLDGTACAVAYAEFLNQSGEEATAAVIQGLHDETLFILDHFGFEYPKIIANGNDFAEIVLVDASDTRGLAGNVDPNKVVEIIDHRTLTELEKFPHAKAQLELVGSCATLIAEKFMAQNQPITVRSAALLYGAIISNTLNFKATLTTDRDRIAAAWLNKTAHIPPDLWKDQFRAKSNVEGENLAKRIEGDFAHFDLGSRAFGIAQLEIMGAEKLVAQRTNEILLVLEKLKAQHRLDFIFQSIIALDEDKNYFIAADVEAKNILEKIFQITFNGEMAERPRFIMRKQITPLIKEDLEKTNRV